jgi:hypothetical protein
MLKPYARLSAYTFEGPSESNTVDPSAEKRGLIKQIRAAKGSCQRRSRNVCHAPRKRPLSASPAARAKHMLTGSKKIIERLRTHKK